MTEIAITATKSHLRSVRARTPAHLVPILDAVIDYGCAHLLVVQGKDGKIGPLPSGTPIISVIGDDLYTSLGPSGFHPSIRKLFRAADVAVIVACAAEQKFYAIAATVAVLERRNAVIVECRTEREIEWVEFAKKHLRTDRIVLCAVRPEGRPQ
jgi:hypothetical protein